MTQNPSLLIVLTATLALLGAKAQAQSAGAPAATQGQPAPPPDTASVFTSSPAAPAPTPAPAEDDHGDPRRIKSDELAGALAESMPKYDPPKPAKPEDQQPDLRDQDKPKNGIIRLPKFVVREAKPPVFTDKDLLTEKGRKDAAMKGYIIDTNGMPAAAAFMSRLLFQANADQQYADAERMSNISSLRYAASAAAADGDAAESDAIRKASNDTLMRHSDWGSIPTTRPDASTPR